MPAAEREQLAARSAGLPVRVETSVSDATAVVQGASAVVTMAPSSACARASSPREA
jgi:hypothetical protein